MVTHSDAQAGEAQAGEAQAGEAQAGVLPSHTSRSQIGRSQIGRSQIGQPHIGQVATSGAVVPSFAMPQSFGSSRQVVSSGFRSLDRVLPAGGVRRGSLVEWLADDAAGAVALAAAVACRLARTPSFDQPAAGAATIVVVDRGARFHPPAVLPWLELPWQEATAASLGGSDSGRGRARPHLVVARPSRDDDELWAIDQSLRCPGVAAVLAWPRRVHATAMRRWQLAARASGTVGLLVRGVTGPIGSGLADAVRAARREPNWADARVAVSAVEAAPSGNACGLQTGLSPAGLSPAVRGLRLSLVGGPWAGDAMLEDRSMELWLDLARGSESSRRCTVAPRHGSGMGGLACRAS